MKKPKTTTPEPVRQTTLLGESWTDADLMDARHLLGAVYEGVNTNLPFDRVKELGARGLVYDIKALPGRGRYANRYTYQWSDKLEALVRAAQAIGTYSTRHAHD